MSEGISSISRPALVTRDRSADSADSLNDGDKARRRFTRNSQRGEVNRVLERMNSQSALLSETASTFKTQGVKGRRSNRLSLTSHDEPGPTSRFLSQSVHVGGSRNRPSLLERLDSETSFGSTGSFGGEGSGEFEKAKEKPASFRPRPRLISRNNSSDANRVLGRMESKRTLTDLIEETQSRNRPSRTRSGMSTSSREELEPTQEDGDSADDKEGSTPKLAARRVLGRLESKRTLTDLVSDTNARSSRPTRTRPTLAALGIPERKPTRIRSETNTAPGIPARRRPTRSSSTSGTPGASPLPKKNGRLSGSRRHHRSASMEMLPSPRKEQVEQEAYALEMDAERKRLEAMELLRQAEEAEEEANRKMAEAAAAAAEPEVAPEAAVETTNEVAPEAAPAPKTALESALEANLEATPKMTSNASVDRASVVSGITIEGSDSDESDSDSDSSEGSSSEDDSSDDESSAAVSKANSDSSSDVYLDDTEGQEEMIVPMPVDDVDKEKLVSKTQRLRQFASLSKSNGYDGLEEEGNNSGDEEEIQRRADERRRLREAGHLDMISPVVVGGLNKKSGYSGGSVNNSAAPGSGRLSEEEAPDETSNETSNEASNDDESIRRRARDRRIRELEQKATTSSSSFSSAMIGLDSGEDEGGVGQVDADADRARRKAERMERRSKRVTNSALEQQLQQQQLQQPPLQSPEVKAQRKAEREKEIEKRKAELEARRSEAQKRKEERRKLLGVRDVVE